MHEKFYVLSSIQSDSCFQNRKNLSYVNEDPVYTEFIPVGAKPYTLFKSIYTNNTNRFELPVPCIFSLTPNKVQ